ncbi:hypothetical protein H6P81_013367 [Aristolochia fimbriata]|uniref:Methyltransferase-like protein 13 n=1 Tax=Aristolochia fimbriata TaxID=158543 RepID=A0AAV7EF06_ARIFI|nr:hypothetical protein H6P81_013367 [Aristolochia fimbriata]
MGAIENDTFQSLVPSRFITFSFPNPDPRDPANPHGDLLRVAVLDSPLSDASAPRCAALLVPKGRELDWIFSTENGHLQLLFNSHGVSRLILIGDLPRETDVSSAVYVRPEHEVGVSYLQKLKPLLFALAPKEAFRHGLPDTPFISYEDNVIRSASVSYHHGQVVGDMVVEDVEVESGSPAGREFHRRLRLKRMPNLVQTAVRLLPETQTGKSGGEATLFRPVTASLIQPYLEAMAAGLSLLGPRLENNQHSSSSPLRVLCLGVGGGALLMFLRTWFEFDLLGIEADEAILTVARRYFGLTEDRRLRICVRDGIELLKGFVCQRVSSTSVGRELARFWAGEGSDNKVDVGIEQCRGSLENTGVSCNSRTVNEAKFLDEYRVHGMLVDLDSSDARTGLSAPPLKFVDFSVLQAARLVLHEDGVIVVNVIPPSNSFYFRIVTELKAVFSELYEIDVGNGENYVLIATASPIEFDARGSRNGFADKLKELVDDRFLNSIKKL